MPWPFDRAPTKEENARWRREFEAARSFEDADDVRYAFRPVERSSTQHVDRVISRTPLTRVAATPRPEDRPRAALPSRHPRPSAPHHYDPSTHGSWRPSSASQDEARRKPMPSAPAAHHRMHAASLFGPDYYAYSSGAAYSTHDLDARPRSQDEWTQLFAPDPPLTGDTRASKELDESQRASPFLHELVGSPRPRAGTGGQGGRNGILWKGGFGGNFTGGH